jgi:hypothetical protein
MAKELKNIWASVHTRPLQLAKASGPQKARSRSLTAAHSLASCLLRRWKSRQIRVRDGTGWAWASRIFSRYYAAQTVDGDQVIQLHGEAAPDWFAPLSDWDFKNSKLPLLLGGVQAPASAGGGLGGGAG